jgi:hypothetical protein
MVEDLVKRLRALDLLITELEGDEWCDAVDAILQEAADMLEHLNEASAERLTLKRTTN